MARCLGVPNSLPTWLDGFSAWYGFTCQGTPSFSHLRAPISRMMPGSLAGYLSVELAEPESFAVDVHCREEAQSESAAEPPASLVATRLHSVGANKSHLGVPESQDGRPAYTSTVRIYLEHARALHHSVARTSKQRHLSLIPRNFTVPTHLSVNLCGLSISERLPKNHTSFRRAPKTGSTRGAPRPSRLFSPSTGQVYGQPDEASGSHQSILNRHKHSATKSAFHVQDTERSVAAHYGQPHNHS
jgi:hypothetical protein